MVGLLYIHDPKCKPEQHADEAQQLLSAFDNEYPMAVFKLKQEGGVQGDLLSVVDDGSGAISMWAEAGADDDAAGGAADGGDAGSDDDDVANRDQDGTGKKRQQVDAEQTPGCRLLTFEEYLQMRSTKQQQEHGQQQATADIV